MNQPDTTPEEDGLLAYLRGELDDDGIRALERRLRTKPDLRQELHWLQDMASEAFIQRFEAHEAEQFRDFQARARVITRQRNDDAYESLLQRAVAWLRGHALVLQGGLTVLVVSLAVTLSSISRRHSPAVVPSPSGQADFRGVSENCLMVLVQFRAGVSLQQTTDWLNRYDASIHAGPDAQGRYRVALESAALLHHFLADPDAKALTTAATIPQGCPWPR